MFYNKHFKYNYKDLLINDISLNINNNDLDVSRNECLLTITKIHRFLFNKICL